jgi:hypothetical protein
MKRITAEISPEAPTDNIASMAHGDLKSRVGWPDTRSYQPALHDRSNVPRQQDTTARNLAGQEGQKAIVYWNDVVPMQKFFARFTPASKDWRRSASQCRLLQIAADSII